MMIYVLRTAILHTSTISREHFCSYTITKTITPPTPTTSHYHRSFAIGTTCAPCHHGYHMPQPTSAITTTIPNVITSTTNYNHHHHNHHSPCTITTHNYHYNLSLLPQLTTFATTGDLNHHLSPRYGSLMTTPADVQTFSVYS